MPIAILNRRKRYENGVAIYPIEELEMLDPRDKSYVAVDDMYYITNIIEISDWSLYQCWWICF